MLKVLTIEDDEIAAGEIVDELSRRGFSVDWIDNGAYFYVCGDAKAMAKDVRKTLVDAFADVKALSADAAEQAVQELERARRYLQDVY